MPTQKIAVGCSVDLPALEVNNNTILLYYISTRKMFTPVTPELHQADYPIRLHDGIYRTSGPHILSFAITII